MEKIDLIIDALLVAPTSVWSKRMDEVLFVARELKAELTENRLRVDAERYRWLNKYGSQLFMVTEKQMNDEIDRIMARS